MKSTKTKTKNKIQIPKNYSEFYSSNQFFAIGGTKMMDTHFAWPTKFRSKV